MARDDNTSITKNNEQSHRRHLCGVSQHILRALVERYHGAHATPLRYAAADIAYAMLATLPRHMPCRHA